ncbi:hypothetical protein TRSC58_07419 [Trypanosoma rangeli SC58]|uniref:Uncharacterized protein n=1 Tax=Trypanosoma rangeli SC58 TaxID=429131 RepID=A0A061IVC6_TRYRA|nr:hypothetical protein TRSC58_07419 [Trypanosoma rangeli SC58]
MIVGECVMSHFFSVYVSPLFIMRWLCIRLRFLFFRAKRCTFFFFYCAFCCSVAAVASATRTGEQAADAWGGRK